MQVRPEEDTAAYFNIHRWKLKIIRISPDFTTPKSCEEITTISPSSQINHSNLRFDMSTKILDNFHRFTASSGSQLVCSSGSQGQVCTTHFYVFVAKMRKVWGDEQNVLSCIWKNKQTTTEPFIMFWSHDVWWCREHFYWCLWTTLHFVRWC